MSCIRAWCVGMMLVGLVCVASKAKAIETVLVGNPGNAPDLEGAPKPAGGVAYEYRLGKYEVTNSEYVEFLNAVDPSGANPLGLYNGNMAADLRGGIAAWNVVGGYAVKENMGNKPVNYVSSIDALRFANWLHNGQGNGGTEFGAYTINGTSAVPRTAGAQWFLPSEDEWYKAAYSVLGGYATYPTQSYSVPALASADAVGNGDGAGANGGANAIWNGVVGNVTTVGTNGPAGYYGTFDQGGNVKEWNDTINLGLYYGLRGEFYGGVYDMARTNRSYDGTAVEYPDTGFRIASVPDPQLPPPPGDYDDSGVVDAADYDTWKLAFGTAVTPLTGADGNGDGTVDAADYTIWRDNLGAGEQGFATGVPEPSALMLIVCGLSALATVHRRRLS